MRNDAIKLEKHHAVYEIQPVTSYEYRGVKIGIGQGFQDTIYFPVNDRQRQAMKDFPNGHYEMTYTIFQGEKPYGWNWLCIDKNHDIDKGWTEHAREESRITAVKNEAAAFVDELLKVAFFDEKKVAFQ